MELSAFQAYWKKLLGEDMYAAASFEKLYPASTKLDAYRQHLKAQADLLLEQNRIAGSILKAKNPGSKVYVYYFDHPTPGRDREYYGAWHSSDLWYTFNSFAMNRVNAVEPLGLRARRSGLFAVGQFRQDG